MVGRGPRQVKRSANLYQLIKVGLKEPDRLKLFAETHDHPGYRHVALLLAIVVGFENDSDRLFDLLERSSQKGGGAMWRLT